MLALQIGIACLAVWVVLVVGVMIAKNSKKQSIK
jgi:hypothetical protein